MKKFNLLMASSLAFSLSVAGQRVSEPSSQILETYVLQDATNQPSYRTKDNGKNGLLAAPGNVIWSENFGSGTTLPSGWTATVLSGRAGKSGWAWTNQMSQGQYAAGTSRIQSTTGSNGLMILDADAHNTPTGTGFVEVDAYVEIPLPNLALYNSVILQFEHYWRPFSNAEMLIEVTGNGTTWDTINVTHNIPVNQSSDFILFGARTGRPYIEKINLSKQISGTSNPKIRFHWRGTSHYFWQVDDIKLIEGEYNDIDMVQGYLKPLTDSTRKNFQNFYSRMPKAQAASYPINFAGVYSNGGAITQTNVEVVGQVTGPNFHNYSATSTPKTLAYKNTDSNSVVGTAYLNSGQGKYDISIFTTSDSVLVRNSADTIKYSVTVTDTTYARDRLDGSGGSVVYYTARPFEYEVGVLFDIFAVDTVSSVSFFIPAENFDGAGGGKYSVHIYRAGDYGANGILNLGSNPIFSSNTYSLTQLGAKGSADKWVSLKVARVGGGLDTLVPGRYVVTYKADQNFQGDTVWNVLEGRNGWQSHYFFRANTGSGFGNWSYYTNQLYIRLNTKGTSCPVLNGGATATATTACGLTNGTASAVDPNNGGSPYTYYWLHNGSSSKTLTGLGAGIYTVEIKDLNGCTMRASATVSDAGAPIISNESVTNVVCAGDGLARVQFNLTPGSSGYKNYTFTWKDAQGNLVTNATRKDSVLSGIPAGTYSVQISDGAPNPCIVSKTYVINGPKDTLRMTDPITAGTATNPMCFGASDGSAVIYTAGGTTPYTYTWADNSLITTGSRVGLAAGTYNVTVKDANNCTHTINFALTNPPALQANVTTSRNSTTNEVQFTAIAQNQQGGVAFKWYVGGSLDGTGSPYFPKKEGIYTMETEDGNGCKATAVWPGSGTSYEWNWSVGIQEGIATDEVRIYPNPTSGLLNVAFQPSNKGYASITLKNVLGQELIQRKVELDGVKTESFDLKGFNSGVYFLTIDNKTNQSTYRVIVR